MWSERKKIKLNENKKKNVYLYMSGINCALGVCLNIYVCDGSRACLSYARSGIGRVGINEKIAWYTWTWVDAKKEMRKKLKRKRIMFYLYKFFFFLILFILHTYFCRCIYFLKSCTPTYYYCLCSFYVYESRYILITYEFLYLWPSLNMLCKKKKEKWDR